MLILKQEDYNKIVDHAKKGLPNEACGLLGGYVEGDKRVVTDVYLLRNVDESREHFSMDPAEQLAAIKDIRQKKGVLLGNFHSHPESPSRPSQEDIRLAYELPDPLPDEPGEAGAQFLPYRKRRGHKRRACDRSVKIKS